MPGISEISSALCGEGLSQPLGVEMLGVELSQYSGTTEGATGVAPLVMETCDERPTCQSCENMLPFFAWTALVILFQPATCSSEYIPGAPNHPRPVIEIEVPSELIKPPSEAR